MARALTGWLAALALGLWLGLALAAGGALAQGPAVAPDYAAWERTAQRAEDVVETGRASTEALEALRGQVAGFRDDFLTASQSVNQARIATLRGQIEALGPPPEEGAEEPADIAARRAELQAQLEKLRAPVLTAEEAFSRANGIIGEIDRLIRERQAEELMALGPSPLNPQLWPRAAERLSGSARDVLREIAETWATKSGQRVLRQNLPAVLALGLLAALMLLRGPRWVMLAGERLSRRAQRGAGVWSLLISFLQVLVPLGGLIALTLALRLTGLAGMRGEMLLANLVFWGGALLFIRWLGLRMFHREEDQALLPLAQFERAEARWYSNTLALVLVARAVVQTLADFEGYRDATLAVLAFPVLVLVGLVLFRLGQVLTHFAPPDHEAEGDPSLRYRAVRLIGRLSMLVAVLGPLLAAIGYRNLAESLTFPWVTTLALVGLVMILQRFVSDLYRLLTGKGDQDADSLIPVLIGFLLTLAALPLLALIWGARVADLTEIWARFREGFTLGGSRISPTDFLAFAAVFVLGYVLTRMVQGALRSSILPKTKIDIGGQNAIVSGMGYVGIILAALVAVAATGLDLSSLAIVAGALSVGIGFGLQNIVSNFVSGIILLIERPVSEGDWIEVNGLMGYVRAISVRSTRIETFDRTDVIIPNSDLISGVVTNWTRGNTIGRVIVPVGVAYGTDTRKVEKVLLEIAEAHPMVLANPAPYVYFKSFGASSLDFEIRAILRDINWIVNVHTTMNHEIARRFAEEGIEIPFAQRDVWLRNPEALRGALGGEQGAAGGGAAGAPPRPPMEGDLPGDGENA